MITSTSFDGKPASSASVGKLTTSSFDGYPATSPPDGNSVTTSSVANALKSSYVLNTKKSSSASTCKNQNVGASIFSSITLLNKELISSDTWDDADTVCSSMGQPSSLTSLDKCDEETVCSTSVNASQIVTEKVVDKPKNNSFHKKNVEMIPSSQPSSNQSQMSPKEGLISVGHHTTLQKHDTTENSWLSAPPICPHKQY
eukprot:4222817-Ditylum_brightwellii.AAC.1